MFVFAWISLLVNIWQTANSVARRTEDQEPVSKGKPASSFANVFFYPRLAQKRLRSQMFTSELCVTTTNKLEPVANK